MCKDLSLNTYLEVAGVLQEVEDANSKARTRSHINANRNG